MPIYRSVRRQKSDLAPGTVFAGRRARSRQTTYDRLSEALEGVERDIARAALADPNVTRLMTVPGIGMVVAVGLMAAIGKIERLDSPDKLVA